MKQRIPIEKPAKKAVQRCGGAPMKAHMEIKQFCGILPLMKDDLTNSTWTFGELVLNGIQPAIIKKVGDAQ